MCCLPPREKENESSSPKAAEAWSWRGFQRKVGVTQQEIKGELKPSVRGNWVGGGAVTERTFLQQCITQPDTVSSWASAQQFFWSKDGSQSV